jgi:hypothetical protein
MSSSSNYLITIIKITRKEIHPKCKVYCQCQLYCFICQSQKSNSCWFEQRNLLPRVTVKPSSGDSALVPQQFNQVIKGPVVLFLFTLLSSVCFMLKQAPLFIVILLPAEIRTRCFLVHTKDQKGFCFSAIKQNPKVHSYYLGCIPITKPKTMTEA